MRDLHRGHGVGLPSGEAVARHIGVEPLTADEIAIAATGETPLWYYILREADIFSSAKPEWQPQKKLCELLAS